MMRFLLRVWRCLRAEIVLGFLIATVFWTGVLGWQAAYAPTDAEKQKCYEATEQSGHKAEECKTLWERTTSDPVAFFTLWLVIFTGGLTVSTVLLWLAGERQFRHGRRSSAAQSRDMQGSIKAAESAAKAAQTSADSAVAVERGRLYAVIDHNFLNCINAANDWDGPIDQEERPLAMPTWPMAGITFKNYGKTPAIIEEVGTGIEYSEAIPVPVYDVKVVNKNIIGPGDESHEFGTVITGQMTMAQAIKVKDGAANIWAYGYVTYDDIFGNRQTHRFFQRLVRVSQFHYVLQSYDHKHYNQSS
jgi:hypothetical protein